MTVSLVLGIESSHDDFFTKWFPTMTLAALSDIVIATPSTGWLPFVQSVSPCFQIFLHHYSSSCPSKLAYSNIVYPRSIYLHYNLSQLAGLMEGAYIPPANSDLFVWGRKLYPWDVHCRLQLGLANTCGWSDSSADYFGPAATTFVSGVGFCSIWIFNAVGFLPLRPTPSLEYQEVYFPLTPHRGPVQPG